MNTIYLYRKILEIVSIQTRKRIIYSIILGIINSLIDVLTLSAIFPAVYIATQPSVIHQNKFLSYLYNTLNFSNTEQFILFALILVLILFLLRLFLFLIILKFQQKISFDAGLELMQMTANAFYIKNILEIKRTTYGELDKEIRTLPFQFINFILMPIGLIASELIVIIIIMTGIISFNFQLFFMLLMTVFPFVILFNWFIRKKIQNFGIELNQFIGENSNLSREMISGYADIKMQNKVVYFVRRLKESIKKYNHIQIRINIYQQTTTKLLEWSALLSILLIYVYALVFKESKTEIIMVLAIYLAAAYRLLPSLNRINSNLLLIRQYEFILDIFEKTKKQLQKHQTEKQPSEQPPILFKQHIELKDICLSYLDTEDQMVLLNINLKINKGEIIGLAGKSGAGKTSLVYVISGLLPPTSGKIIIDHQAINATNIHQWQKHIAFVYQDMFLLNGSILNNIAFGEEEKNIDLAKAWECLKAVQLDDFVKNLPHTIQTSIGESGGYLSGGQKQRLVIARALYRNASLIIMDEATSALDEKTQESVMNAIYHIAHQYQLTVILIAHRISTLKYCNRIFYLENGAISKTISYQDLLEQNN